MPVHHHIECPRCSALAGAECVQRDPDDPSDGGTHSERIHAFIERGTLEQRRAVHEETVAALTANGVPVWFDPTTSLYLTKEEMTNQQTHSKE